MTEQTAEFADRASLVLSDRRAFLALPISERRQRMAEQASRIASHYEGPAERLERESWQGGDVVDGA